jgi:hypothetical protein
MSGDYPTPAERLRNQVSSTLPGSGEGSREPVECDGLAVQEPPSRVLHPGSKLSTLAWWGDVTLGPDLGIADATTDEPHAAMDWLQERQDSIEAKLARRHLAPDANPQRMARFDRSISWLEGSHCPLGYSRDGKKGNVQIEYGLLTDPQGRRVAVRVLEGNTADPAAFTETAGVVKDTFGLKRMVMAEVGIYLTGTPILDYTGHGVRPSLSSTCRSSGTTASPAMVRTHHLPHPVKTAR